MAYQIRSYVVRPGRITRLQKTALETLADRYCVDFTGEPLDPSSLFPGCERLVVEVGFGMGVATAQIAGEHPEVGYLGIEVFRAGVGKLLAEIERRGLLNVRIVAHDAVDVFEQMIPESSLDGVHLFFPDPWPKKRHHKRRLVQPPFTELLARSLKAEGYVYAVTDWQDYARQILRVFEDCASLRNAYDGYAPALDWRPQTKFERKGRAENHTIHEVYFTKI